MNDSGSERDSQSGVTDGGTESDTPERVGRYQTVDGWAADRPDDPAALDSLWIRWTDGGSDLHFHRICSVVPQVKRSDSWPFVRAKQEGDHPPLFRPVRDGEDTSDEMEQFTFVSGFPRQLLRHVPLLILVATVAMFASPELVPGVDVAGLSTLFPQLMGRNAALFALFLAIGPVLLWLLTEVGVVEIRELPSAGVVYGLPCFLGIGILLSLFLVATADHPSQVDRNVVLTSGYLLTLLVGGMALYEATLRIEHLFVKIGERSDDIIENPREYRRFLTDLNDAIDEDPILGLVRPSRLFGVVFALQFLIVWILGSGPQNLHYSVGLVVNFVLNAVLVTIVFKFFILVRYFNKLMNERKEYREIGLHYEPFHIDGYGGFRDFGQFATRINVILTLAGAYLVYRLYIIGGLEFPTDGLTGFTDPVVLTIWFVNFLGPVVAYGLGAAAWGYYSFWSMHVKMERDKQLLARRFQGKRGGGDLNRTPSAGDTIDSFEYCEGPNWSAFRAAPTWPLDVNKMVSLISGNAVPLLLPVFNLFL